VKGGRCPTREVPRGARFTIAGRVAHWEPIARELTIGGRVLRVAASVFFIDNIAVGARIMASGDHPRNVSDQWVVTQLRVG
jgi:hypothetical protein